MEMNRDTWRNLAAFWCIGVLNNSAYVIMNAGASEIANGAVGVVYLANVGPSLVTKLTLPFWAHRVGYTARVLLCGVLMAVSFFLVGFGKSLPIQLLGVACSSVQSGLGEASMLAYTSKFHTRSTLTAWSSGTGFAGVFGYAWVTILHQELEVSFKATLLSANVLVFLWLLSYFFFLSPATSTAVTAGAGNRSSNKGRRIDINGDDSSMVDALLLPDNDSEYIRDDDGDGDGDVGTVSSARKPAPSLAPAPSSSSSSSGRYYDEKGPGSMTFRETTGFIRTKLFVPYMLPLMVVYFSEYAIQSGAWAAIGFPIDEKASRTKFYLYANWTYQAGVFVSRSSGTLLQANRRMLQVLPAVQVVLLTFFCMDSIHHFWWNWSLLLPCFVTGLVGGGVYVNAFTLLAKEVEPSKVELALGVTSVADSFGIVFSDIGSIFIQGCLFRWNSLEGAAYECECCAPEPNYSNHSNFTSFDSEDWGIPGVYS